jgi:RNA polymerase sigma factor (sigma-70 family)
VLCQGILVAGDGNQYDDLIRGLRAGEAEAVHRFCALYGPLLEKLADKNLPPGLRRRVDRDDIAQSACRTFLRRIRLGQFQLPDSDALWRLLCAIALTKVREQTRFHLAQRRGLGQEQPLAAGADTGAASADLVDREPTPVEAAEFADQFQRLMATLDDEEQQVVDLKLQDCTNDEVAERLGCSERTARRLLKRVQSKLSRLF